MHKTKKGFIKRAVAMSMIAIMCIAGGCGDSQEEGDNNQVSKEDINDTDSGSDSDKTAKGFQISDEDAKLYDDLFSLDSNIAVNIDIADEELAKIEADYVKYRNKNAKSPIYRKCDVTITVNGCDYVITEVGIRMKGNTSRTNFYNKQDGVYNLTHFRLSFNETFDDENYYGSDAKVWDSEDEKKEREKRTFASLKGLELKWNREVDLTYTRETYAYKMYRDFGLLAPNNTLSKMIVNDKSWGVYKLYEPVDKIFIKRNLEEEEWGGDLYKCTWASGPADYTRVEGNAGVDDDDNGKRFTYSLKTNKKTSKNEALANFINTINKNDLTKEDIESVVDVDNFVKFMAVSYFLGMPDDMRNNYNNHFVYFKPDSGKAVFIPYDCDLCLGIEQWNPTGKFMISTDPFSDFAYGNNSGQNNKLIVKGLTKSGLLYDEYSKALEEVANSKWLTLDNFKSIYDKIEKNYSQEILPEIKFDNITRAQKTMSIDDSYVNENNEAKKKNLNVEKYFEKILQSYNLAKNS